MSILSFPLKKQQRSVVWLYFFVLETKREMNQQPEVLKKEQRKKGPEFGASVVKSLP